MQLWVNFRSLSPPPTFNMQMMHQDLKRLSRGQHEIEDKLRDQQAQVSIAMEYTSRHVDSSALLLDDLAMTLTQRLASLEDITRRLQQDDSTYHSPTYSYWTPGVQ